MVDPCIAHAKVAKEPVAPRSLIRVAYDTGWGIRAIAILFVLLGVVYNLATPPFEAPDETSHFVYVKRLADGEGLPPLHLSDHDVAQGEMHQPPLYYALGALLVSGLDTGTPDTAFALNPYAALGEPHAPGNKNVVLHNGAEPPGTRGVTWAVHLLRGLSTLLATATVLLTYHMARRLAPGRPAVALGATALVAFNPQFLFISAAVSNDPLATMLATATLYQAVRIADGEMPSTTAPWLIGLSAGLAMLAKVNAGAVLGLIPLGYLGAYLHRPPDQRRAWRQLVGPVVLGTSVALLVGGWWYVRNAVRFGDPLTMRTLRNVFGIYDEPLSLTETFRVMRESLVSFWGVFGWMNVLADEAYYVFVRLLTAMGVGGLLLAAMWLLWHRHRDRLQRWHTVGLVAIWVSVLLLSYAQFTRSIAGPQGRLLFPAISGIAFFLCLGLCSWVPARYNGALVGSIVGVLLVVAASAPFRYIAPTYAAPRRVALEDAPTDMRDLGISFGDDLFLLGYDMDSPCVVAGEALHLRLYWVATSQIEKNLTMSLRVYGRQGELIGQMDTYPAMGALPTRAWVPGEVVFDEYTIPISGNAITPVAARVRLGVYHGEDMVHLAAVDAQQQDIGTGPEIARVRVASEDLPDYRPDHPLDVNLGDRVRFMGYDLTSAKDAQAVSLTLYWQRIGPVDGDWTVFAHVLDGEGELVTQMDEQPLSGDYPTSFWQLGEVIQDVHTMDMPDELPPGEYAVRVGLYRLETGERLPVVGADPGVNYVTIGPLTVEPR